MTVRGARLRPSTLATPDSLRMALVAWALPVFRMVPARWLVVATIFVFPLSLAGLVPPLARLGPVNLQVVDILLVVLVVQLVLSAAIEDRPVLVPGVLRWFLAYLLLATVSTLWRAIVDPVADLAWREAVALARAASQVLLLLAVVNVVAAEKCAALLMRAVRGFGIVFAASVWAQRVLFMVGIPLGAWAGGTADTATRFSGLLGDTSRAALILMFFAFLAACDLARATGARGRALSAALLMFYLGALLLTGTRGVLLGLVAGWAALTLLRGWRGVPVRRLVVEHAIGVVAAAGLLALAPQFRVPFARLLHGSPLAAVENRLAPMADAVRLVAEHPWLGLGFGGGGLVPRPPLYSTVNPNQIWPRGSYNVYLEAALNAGIVGLLAFVLFAAAALTFALRAAQSAAASGEPHASFVDAILVYLAALLVGTQTEAWLLPGESVAYFFWLLLGVSLAVAREDGARWDTA